MVSVNKIADLGRYPPWAPEHHIYARSRTHVEFKDPRYSDSDQQGTCTAFRGFVQVHQQLLNTLIGKHGLLSLTTTSTQTIAAVIRASEGAVDHFAFPIIDTVPSCAQDATQNKNSLDLTFEDADQKYQT